MSKPKRSPVEGQVGSVASQDRAGQTADYSAAQGTNAQFEGPVTDSPFYKALLTTGTDATSNAYQNAMSRTKSAGKAAGFGYASPVEQGAEAEQTSQEASTMSALPAKAAAEAAPLSLEASSQTAGMGTALGSEGVSYSGQQVDLEKQYQQQLAAQQQAMWNALAQIPQTALSFETGMG